MIATRSDRAVFRGAALRRIRLLGAAGWVAGCANLLGLDDYSESDASVRPTTGGDGAAGAAGASEAGSPGAGGRGSGGRPPTSGGRAATTGGAPSARGGNPPVEGGEGPGPSTGGHRATGGRRGGVGGTAPTGGAESSGGTAPASGGTATTGGAPPSGGSAPVTGGTAPTGGANATGGAPVTSCALAAYPADCGACIDESCSSRCDPCLDDGDCKELVACAQGCSSGSCLEGCFDAHPASLTAFLDVYDSCAFTTCASTCGARFGGSCDEDDDCASGTCSGPGGFCTELCDDHEDCPSEGWCAPDVDGIPRCLMYCGDDELACPAAQQCGYVSTIDDYALPLCTPLKALSEPCTSDDECHSFWCSGTPSSQGFCYNSCFDNLSCAPDASCVLDSFADPMCLVGCFDSTDCAPFPASECSAEIDVEGYDADVCWL